MTTAVIDAKEAKKEALKARAADMDAREAKLNEGKSGKGTRTVLAMTRGKNPQEIQCEQWDESKPETLPGSVSEFMELAGVKEESELLRRMILGDNEVRYTEASDPVAEYVDASWPQDLKTRFRTIVRQYATSAEVSIEDAVNLIKPGIVASLAKA